MLVDQVSGGGRFKLNFCGFVLNHLPGYGQNNPGLEAASEVCNIFVTISKNQEPAYCQLNPNAHSTS